MILEPDILYLVRQKKNHKHKYELTKHSANVSKQQCDALSALLFRLFLAISLKNQDVNEEILSQPKYADYITYGNI